MNVSSMAVRRGVTFSMLYLIIVGFGAFAFSQLKLDLFPELKFPTVAIINNYTGVSPEEMETLVSRPLESAVASVKNVKRISTTAKLGVSVSIVELTWGTNIDQALLDIREKIDIIRKTLPEEARQPILFAFDPALQPILLLSISGSGDMTQLRDLLTRRISPLIERLPGIASAQINGGQKREIQILVNPIRLRSYGLSINDIMRSVAAENVQVASGNLSQGDREFSLRTMGNYKSIQEIRNTVVGYKGQPLPQPVHLHQVAQVKDGHEEETRVILADGRPGMMMLIQKRSDANTVIASRAVTQALPDLKRRLPPGTEMTVTFNQSEIITQSISNLNSSGLQAFLLSVLVLLFFLRSFRTSLIIAISIPVSVIATFSVMYAAGITLNIISMAGLALAVGMLVDNSIVVLENVFRHFEEGMDPWEASIQGSKEVGLSITASTLTTLAVFVPILFVPGIAGALFRDMVITICFSLTASLIVAITLIPLLASRLLRVQTPEEKESAKPGFFDRFMENLLGLIDRVYARSLDWALVYRKTTVFLGFGTFAFVILLASLIKTDFLPKTDDSMIAINFERSPGTSLQETLKTATYMEKVVRQKFGSMIESSLIETGVGDGFSSLFGKGSYAGLLRLKLKPIRQRPLHKWEIIDQMRAIFRRLPDLKFSPQDIGPGAFGGQGDIDIQLYGYDLAVAKALSEDVKGKVATINNVGDITASLEEGKPELQIHLHRDRIQALGLNPFLIGNTISTAFKGNIAGLFRDRGNEYSILVRLQESYRNNIDHLKRLYITTPTGKSVPLESVADIKIALSPVKIERKDQQRVTTVAVNVKGNDLGNVVTEVRKLLNSKVNMPEDFYYQLGGKAEDFIASFSWLGVAFLVSILLVYMVMASQFESLFAPFVILFSIPLSGVGVLLALILTQTALSVTALIGVVMLVGIVVNNAIVLIDFVIQIRQEKNLGVVEACAQAGRVRLRPILMTSATTILGMLPLALGIGEGSENWMGLGRVVMGGMISSTFLTLLVIPAFYASLTLTGEALQKRFGRSNRRPAPPPAAPHPSEV